MVLHVCGSLWLFLQLNVMMMVHMVQMVQIGEYNSVSKIADCSSAMLIVQYCYLETESKCQIVDISGDKHFVCLMMPFEAIDFHLPNIYRFLCWKHAINAVKFWLRMHGATASEVPVYVSDIRDLFHQENNYVWGTQAEILICTFCFGF